jgi:cation:H+ antiporter
MNSIILNIVLLLVGFALLIKGADYLVIGASALARRYKVSELVIGLTVVAFGTSTPELIVNVVSATNGLNDVAFGNVIGSNILNLLFIVGLSAAILPITVQRSTIFKEIPYSIIAAIVLLLLANDHLYNESRPNSISLVDAILLLVLFLLFIFYVFKNIKNDDPDIQVDHKNYSILTTILFILGGLAGLIFGGRMSVNNAVEIAHSLGISERIIGLTIIAAGTSLPELATSAVAAYKRNSDIAIGNVVGSNIFNIFLVLGITALIRPLPYPITFNTDITVLIAGSFLLLFFTYSGRKAVIERWEGICLLLCYLGYTVWLIIS